ncbi:MAG TPA: TonB-dependent receptor [Ferruginibacter sp.]|nr:TonB-dependent receptor [Ferruginibacter sp.]
MKQIQCILLFILFSAGALTAQKKTITGKVINQNGNDPLLGVNVLADKQKNGAATKSDGSYSISVDKNATVLIFSYVGFTTQTILIESRTVIDVVMVPAATTGEEVVIIGYGTQKRSNVSGAVSKYQNDRLEETPSSRLDQALQGKIAGVQIQNISSEAGADPKIQVRGLTSINQSQGPLVVVDGHPVPDGLAFVNMADVQSVEVLKDAASSAIYGSRGSGGVIMITTKSGKANRTQFGFKFSTGIKTAYELYPMMTTTEYTNMLFYEAALKLQDPGITPPTLTQIASTAERGAYIIEQQMRGGTGTDWQSVALRNANTKNIQLSISGGNSGVKYFISGGYQNDQGMMYHSEYERYSVRAKIDAQVTKRVKFSFNVNPSYIKRERPSVNYIDFVRFQSYLPVYLDEAMAAFVRQDPLWADVRAGDWAQARYFNARTYGGLMPDGSVWASTPNVTPFATANNQPKSIMETRSITSNDYRVLASGDLTINIIPGLDFKSMGSVYVSYSSTLDFAKRNSAAAGTLNRGQYNDRLFIDLLNENTLTWTKQIKEHAITALAGFTVQKTSTKNEQAIGLDYPSDNITTLNNALQIQAPFIDAEGRQQGTYTDIYKEGLVSWLGRVNYAFKDRYLLSASIRADGSSHFAPGHKWGSFPSVSVGWVATKEKFLEKINWLNNLKLRGSYGLTGNNKTPPHAWNDLLYAANYPTGPGNAVSSPGYVPSRVLLANPDITWERTNQLNGGIDITVLNNAVSLTVDIYQTKTEKLLLRQNILAFTGATSTVANIGSMKNNGIELELSTNNIRKKNFRWSTTANFAHTKNNITELGGEKFLLNQGERTELYMNKVAGPLIQFFGYKTDGVWLSQAEINAAQAAGLTSALPSLFVPGGLKLVDVNGDKVIDINDRVVTGNPYPDFTWGITNNLKYKNFDLMFMFQGVQGGSLINGDPNYNETKRYNKNYNQNRWLSPMFPGDGKTPYSTVGFNWMLTDYVVEDASFWSLREILVGYTLPDKLTKKARLSSLRIYFSAQNIFFHSADGYRGINSEGRFTSGPYVTPLIDGYQRGSFPMAKTYLFGIDLNF